LGDGLTSIAMAPLGGRISTQQTSTRRGLWFPILLFLVSRAALLLGSQLMLSADPALYYRGGADRLLHDVPAVDGLCRWDCEYYERIMREGAWAPLAANFSFGYPLLARALSATGLPAMLVLLLLPNLAALAAMLVLYVLFEKLAGTSAARWGLALFVAWPFAFFQAAAYPESFLTLFTALGLALALSSRTVSACLVLALGVVFKQLVVLASFGVLAVQLKPRLLRPSSLALLLPGASVGAWLLYLWRQFGDPLAFWTVRTSLSPLASWRPWDVVLNRDWNALTIPVAFYLPLVLALTVPALVYLWRAGPPALAAFLSAHVAVLLWMGLWALGRHASSCWPAFLPWGVWLAQHPRLRAPVLALFIGGQLCAFFLFVHQYPVL
jgi:hypothetical protein